MKMELFIYDLPLGLIVIPLEVKPLTFKIKTTAGNTNSMILKYLPDNSWIAEKSTMKFFTKKHIEQLGLQIQYKKPEWFHPYS